MAMETPRTNYILIDHENVHALDPGEIGELPVKVLVFLGEQTKKLAVVDVQKLLMHPGKIELVPISGNGKNALDFHVAYYAGRISVMDPRAAIHIVSKDTGFDPLIDHLKEKKVQASRSAEVPDLRAVFEPKPAVPAPKPATLERKEAAPKPPALKLVKSPAAIRKERVTKIETALKKNAKNRPGTRKKVVAFVRSHLGSDLEERSVQAVIDSLASKGVIVFGENDKVTYTL